jgi:hypothetical protein
MTLELHNVRIIRVVSQPDGSWFLELSGKTKNGMTAIVGGRLEPNPTPIFINHKEKG